MWVYRYVFALFILLQFNNIPESLNPAEIAGGSSIISDT